MRHFPRGGLFLCIILRRAAFLFTSFPDERGAFGEGNPSLSRKFILKFRRKVYIFVIDILINTESVSLFLKIERRKFAVERIGRHFAASYPLWISAWAVSYFIYKVIPTTRFSKISFQRHAFLFYRIAIGVRMAKILQQ